MIISRMFTVSFTGDITWLLSPTEYPVSLINLQLHVVQFMFYLLEDLDNCWGCKRNICKNPRIVLFGNQFFIVEGTKGIFVIIQESLFRNQPFNCWDVLSTWFFWSLANYYILDRIVFHIIYQCL